MKSPLVIALWGNDHFFLQGLKYVLEAYFYEKGIPVVFIPLLQARLTELSMVDLMVKDATVWSHRRYGQCNITITWNQVSEGGQTTGLQREIHRYEKPEAFVRLLDELSTSPPMKTARDVPRIKISAREREVLMGIAAELTQNQIAEMLNISIKTVSGHKHTAMRKLGFKRTYDLYSWLLQSGICIAGKRV